MAKQKKKPVKSQPITSHQLFPAVVGLWFGALFGLGSLAVRPSLLEDMVLSTRIDLIIPAAAPPLGITARIMLALVMAIAGTMLGVVMARRLTRPKPEVKERARTARGDSAAAPTPQRARDAHPDAPSCTPISMQDLQTGDDLPGNAQTDVRLTGRRRALTVDHGPDEFVPHEFAPLPGGEPQILDREDLASSTVLPTAIEPPVGSAPIATVANPVTMQVPPQSVQAERQVFQAAPSAQPELAPESAAAHADGRQVFGMEQVNPPREQPRQIFGLAAEGDHLPQDFVREAGYKTSIFETEEPQPLFVREPVAAAPEELQSAAFEVAAPESIAAPAPIVAMAMPASPAPVAAEAPPPVPSEPLPSPASLGMTDLAARLAESMRRRRAARSAAPSEPTAIEPVAAQFASPVLDLEPAVEAPATSDEPAVAAPMPSFVASAPEPEAPVQLAAPVQIEQPAVTAEVAQPDLALPTSLRPLALDAFLEEDQAFDASLLPPRRLVAETPAVAEQPAPIPQPFVAPAAVIDEPAEEPIAEESYASLLGIGGQRTGLVRIDEPEADAAAPEPVVIFPGQAPLGQAPQFTPPAPAAQNDDAASLRRFDSPAAAEQGQPVDLGMSGTNVAPDEAAQALRTALASLQRISGAA